jgi:two-component system, response regulator PdtaR
VPPAGPTPEPASRGRGPLVLVVEDEFLLAMELGLLLEGHGYRVLGPAATVAEALRLLEGGEVPDVALLDVNLRGEMVTPVAGRLRALGVPFVLASAYDRPELAAAGLAGAPNVGKPTSERRLLAALAQIVGRWPGGPEPIAP